MLARWIASGALRTRDTKRVAVDTIHHSIRPCVPWRAQEVGVAAARSGATALMEAYLSGDIYHQLAVTCGLTSDTDT